MAEFNQKKHNFWRKVFRPNICRFLSIFFPNRYYVTGHYKLFYGKAFPLYQVGFQTFNKKRFEINTNFNQASYASWSGELYLNCKEIRHATKEEVQLYNTLYNEWHKKDMYDIKKELFNYTYYDEWDYQKLIKYKVYATTNSNLLIFSDNSKYTVYNWKTRKSIMDYTINSNVFNFKNVDYSNSLTLGDEYKITLFSLQLFNEEYIQLRENYYKLMTRISKANSIINL